MRGVQCRHRSLSGGSSSKARQIQHAVQLIFSYDTAVQWATHSSFSVIREAKLKAPDYLQGQLVIVMRNGPLGTLELWLSLQLLRLDAETGSSIRWDKLLRQRAYTDSRRADGQRCFACLTRRQTIIREKLLR